MALKSSYIQPGNHDFGASIPLTLWWKENSLLFGSPTHLPSPLGVHMQDWYIFLSLRDDLWHNEAQTLRGKAFRN